MMEIEAMEIHTIETQALETSAMVMEPQTVSAPAYVEIPAPLYQEKPVYEFFKRCFDIAAAVGLLLVGLLPLLIIALLVKANDGGPVFYKQQRVGRYGRVFELYKFRSMCQNADALHQSLSAEQLEQYKREFKLDDDPRVTRIGKILRKTSLDELPQIMNILRGELSLIGPRPLLEKELEVYGPNREQLLKVRPGLTGYWQAYARNEAGYQDGKRQAMELYYVEHRGFWLDIKIFFKTIGTVLSRKGAL